MGLELTFTTFPPLPALNHRSSVPLSSSQVPILTSQDPDLKESSLLHQV